MTNDWTIPQCWEHYTADEHRLWDRLVARQMELLPSRTVPQFLDGVSRLGLDEPGVPDFAVLSERLSALTGWHVVAVPGLIPDAAFFAHLAERRFVAGNFLRRPDQFDYLQEPDVFHDVFGHAPLLADPVFADYMQAYGEAGLRAEGRGALAFLARLYWYTVEFGLIATGSGLRFYGAGIASSPSESVFCLESRSPHRIAFDLERVMRTRYRIDDFQQVYFVIDSFADLLAKTRDRDFANLYARLPALGDLAPDALLDGDGVLQAGDQAHLRERSRSA